MRLDHTPGGARVQTADPPLAVDVSADTVAALALAPGLTVRLRVAPGAAVRWTFGSAGGEVKADATGLVTIPKLKVTTEPTTLSVRPAK